MKITIRVDSSIQIGTGHLMRTLALANRLREEKASVSFICRDLEGNLSHLVESQKFGLHRLPKPKHPNTGGWLEVTLDQELQETKAVLSKEGEPIDWLIVDHYALDQEWEKALRPMVKRIMVIDDLANRPHDCNLLLDQNLHAGGEKRYEKLVPPECETLLGPTYALLREEFKKAHQTARTRDGTIRRVFIFFGGVDPSHETEKALRALALLKLADIEVDLIVGKENPARENIQKLCADLPRYHFHSQVANISEFMINADLALGAAGTTTWERLSVGLPSVVISIAKNQEKSAECAAKAGAHVYLGKGPEITDSHLAEQIEILLKDKEMMKKISKKAFKLVDGIGVERVVRKMEELL